jgi:hypothetical protein
MHLWYVIPFISKLLFFLTNLITNDMLAFKTTLALYKQICFVQSDEFDWYRNIVS